MNKKWVYLFPAIIILNGLLHYNTFSKDLMGKHVWRQTQTQATISSFYEEDMNILNPRQDVRFNGDGIYRMEFPLMQWLVALTYKIFGEQLIITRIWMFIIGLFSVAGIYKLLNAIFKNPLLAMMGAWAFCWSPAFFYYTINPLPDNLALCFSVWGMALFFEWYYNKKLSLLLVSGFILSLGVLCKLPFVLYGIVPFVYFIQQIIGDGFSKKLFINIIAAFIFLLLPLVWYAAVISGWQDNGIVQGILNSKTPFSTIIGYIIYHLTSTLPELLLNYAAVPFFIIAFYFLVKKKASADKRASMFIAWSLVVTAYFLFEINMIEKVHDYYLFPFYPLLFVLISYGAFHLYQQKKTGKYIALVLLAILPLTVWLRNKNSWNENNPGFNKDLLVYKNDLRNAVPDNALCVAGNDPSYHVFFYYIHKKGWVFEGDNYDAAKLEKAIRGGAEYLYSDSRKFDTGNKVSSLFDSLILERGNIKVYKLKQLH